MQLQTERLVLRPCRPEDRDEFIALERDPEVMRYLNGSAVEHGRIRPDDVTFLMPRGTEPEVWTACRREDGDFVGWFALFEDTAEQGEIGYRVRRDHWGKGLASEGAAALIGLGFDVMGFDRIGACTMTVNRASRRVMEKLGMTHVRTDLSPWQNPIAGSDEGEVWYEITRAAWARGR